MNTRPKWGILASELIELIQKEYKEDEVIGFSIYGKSDIELDLDFKVTDEQWEKFLEAFVTDDNLNEIRAAAWMEAIQIIRDEVEG